jgi:hypothetical protein
VAPGSITSSSPLPSVNFSRSHSRHSAPSRSPPLDVGSGRRVPRQPSRRRRWRWLIIRGEASGARWASRLAPREFRQRRRRWPIIARRFGLDRVQTVIYPRAQGQPSVATMLLEVRGNFLRGAVCSLPSLVGRPLVARELPARFDDLGARGCPPRCEPFRTCGATDVSAFKAPSRLVAWFIGTELKALRGGRSTPGTTPLTSQLALLISTTTTRVEIGSNAAKLRLRSLILTTGQPPSLRMDDEGATTSAARPIASPTSGV